MKKMYLLPVALLAILAGCGKKKSVVTPVAGQTHPAAHETAAKSGNKSLFVEDVEEFVLEDDTNPFSADMPEGSLSLVKPGEEWHGGGSMGKFAFKTIYFDFDEYGLRPDQKNSLELNFAKAKEAADLGHTIVIEGHSCKFAGSSVYNMMLSEKRAQAVAQYFKQRGIPAKQLKVVGRGNEMCIVAEGDRDAQAPNRRVEIYIVK